MTTRLIRLMSFGLVGLTLAAMFPATAAAQSAQARYTAAKAREDKVRAAMAAASATARPAERTPIITEARAIISAYESLVRAYRASGYADNALFNAASLADALHERFSLTTDRDAALRLYKRLRSEYPTAPLARETAPHIARLEQIAEAKAPVPPPMEEPATSVAPGQPATLTSIDRTVLPNLVRITLTLDHEVRFKEESLDGPMRVFFDLPNVKAAPDLVDATLRYPSDIVRQIRIGRHPNAIRVVLDFEEVGRHSTYTLYNPFRIVVDAEPPGSARAVATPSAPRVEAMPPPARPASEISASSSGAASSASDRPASQLRSREPVPQSARVNTPGAGGAASTPVDAATLPSLAVAEPPVVPSVVPTSTTPAGETPKAPDVAGSSSDTSSPEADLSPARPVIPSGNLAGGFSIARQLGLGVSRVVIDPGHGGHDPGAQARGVNEADVTLDIALRLEKLLLKEPGLEVILTRRTDVYIPLEERTAIANREGADLFLSIHANTSRNTSASGVETYYLSFAASADAEAVAARENSAHAGEMHKLPDIIRAITLNNKLDESRDFAGMVQEALVSRLRRSNKSLPNRGVKKAPFVVLIGAEMPSVLAEVSFMTNRGDLQRLKTATYKQRVAEALHAAVMRYRRALKGSATAAAQ